MGLKQRLIGALLGMGSGDRDPLLVLYRRQRLWRAGSRRAQLGVFVGKPVRAWREVRAFLRTAGAGISEQFGVGRARQFLTFYWLSIRHSVYPSASAARWAFGVSRPRKWDAWLSAPHCTLLLSDLADRSSRDVRERISDKSTFAGWGAEKGLPVEPLIAVFAGGRPEGLTAEATAALLPSADLFAKPARLTWGVGARRWLADGPGCWRDEGGRQRTAGEIVGELAEASVKDPYILQRALHTDPALVRLAPHALCSIRCLTYADEAGEPRLLGASLKLPVGEMIVDNISSGGMFVGVDPETGRLTRSFRVRRDKLFEPTEVGPDGTLRLEGVVLAQWPAVLEVALAAQRAAKPLHSIGWDIALTDRGPVILEANIGWSGLTILLTTEVPFAATGFPSSFVHHWNAHEPAPRSGSARHHPA